MTLYYEINQARLDYNNAAAARGLPQMPLSPVLEQCGVTEGVFLAHCDAVRQSRTPLLLTPEARPGPRPPCTISWIKGRLCCRPAAALMQTKSSAAMAPIPSSISARSSAATRWLSMR